MRKRYAYRSHQIALARMLAKKQRGSPSTHIAGAIAWRIETNEEISENGRLANLQRVVQTAPQGAKTNVQTSLCDPTEPANASSLYLAVDRRQVSVRSLHIFPLVCCRFISGSLPLWRISGGMQTFREQSAPRMVVAAHRSMASERSRDPQILPATTSDREHIAAMAEAAGRQ
ncbi:hypothetical protein [Bradyrhizobium sp. SZCCHNR1051]|uniref:hypothetical protein n=1 Tax=Bradyrhizobium sp. SZCCHNR1051 TaxID=3057355 RepID=UPI0029160BD3|nr:hypothetical protein [Bradyrhizobium sp. SZCCHNR1051]